MPTVMKAFTKSMASGAAVQGLKPNWCLEWVDKVVEGYLGEWEGLGGNGRRERVGRVKRGEARKTAYTLECVGLGRLLRS